MSRQQACLQGTMMSQMEDMLAGDEDCIEALIAPELERSRALTQTNQMVAIVAVSNRRPVHSEPLHESAGGELQREFSSPDLFFKV